MPEMGEIVYDDGTYRWRQVEGGYVSEVLSRCWWLFGARRWRWLPNRVSDTAQVTVDSQVGPIWLNDLGIASELRFVPGQAYVLNLVIAKKGVHDV